MSDIDISLLPSVNIQMKFHSEIVCIDTRFRNEDF